MTKFNECFLKNSSQKIAFFLKEGIIGVIPTDTIYGICGLALNKKTVEKIYKLKKRKPTKPMIILISCLDDLKIFKIKLKLWQKNFLLKIWPSKISIILNCPFLEFSYLHRGAETLCFRIPAKKQLIKILKISGPLIAPSANLEDFAPAETISQAKKYFKDKVFYYNVGELTGSASTLIDLTKKPIKILRKGADFKRLNLID
ncbi:threonylcarbamoyl-AMP synthase [Candidatus Kuenenbacteria bacterium HGW-Kuenenbacteria-1]|uniref:L-threonylcarbamoyladenylate synthase n=1 Tax=Candidatus Kuenenbacteria bacterium HGW-Kuenenbacteria-1 TaxID=2013812 RepID=A0A2N1UP33_9BACT|nr:MAG: threonylcarbamoyl-AMP synthase [Candidatus Kuenenbacteria bacterium HGW-Kuenenbacteria-1]